VFVISLCLFCCVFVFGLRNNSAVEVASRLDNEVALFFFLEKSMMETYGDDWKFSQCFGEQQTALEDLNDADLISSIEFNETGTFLATGDRGGRVVIFELDGNNSRSVAESARQDTRPLESPVELRFMTEFQSHEQEFDYLKSLEIEEKIARIRWLRPSNNALFLLSTNEKTIKLHRVREKNVYSVSEFNIGGRDKNGKLPLQPQMSVCSDKMEVEEDGKESDEHEHVMFSKRDQRLEGAKIGLQQDRLFERVGVPGLRIPKIKQQGRAITANPRRVFANAHAYHINSVSVNSDGETFLSADDLRVNHWDLNRSDESFTVVDLKPDNMEELSEVITAAEFHKTNCHQFIFSSSRGTIRLADMRARALCDQQCKVFCEPEPTNNKSFFNEVVSSISDLKFTRDGQYIVSRDYLTVKIWDCRNESRPVTTVKVHDHFRAKLPELYENECIFDRFELAVAGDGSIATGSYNNMFHIYDRHGKLETSIEASKMPEKQQVLYRQHGVNFSAAMEIASDENSTSSKQVGNIDYARKAMHMSWNPNYPLVAVAGLNNLFIYSK